MSYASLQYRRLADWVRFRPLLWAYKTARRRLIGFVYLRKSAPDSVALAAVRARLSGRPVALTVAYNSIWLLRWQVAFGLRHLKDTQRLIADNSSDPTMAIQIEELCRANDIAYVRLPFNRFSLGRPKDPSLSHACAMNWIWHHVVEPADSPIVAILDHDLIPLQPVDLRSKVAAQPFYGAYTAGADHGWQVWPGYVVFDRHALRNDSFDFWVDGRAGLDTGGALWRRIYRRFDPEKLTFVEAPPHMIGRFDEWWHIGNGSGYAVQPPGWKDDVLKTLQHEFDRLNQDSAAAPSSSGA